MLGRVNIKCGFEGILILIEVIQKHGRQTLGIVLYCVIFLFIAWTMNEVLKFALLTSKVIRFQRFQFASKAYIYPVKYEAKYPQMKTFFNICQEFHFNIILMNRDPEAMTKAVYKLFLWSSTNCVPIFDQNRGKQGLENGQGE